MLENYIPLPGPSVALSGWHRHHNCVSITISISECGQEASRIRVQVQASLGGWMNTSRGKCNSHLAAALMAPGRWHSVLLLQINILRGESCLDKLLVEASEGSPAAEYHQDMSWQYWWLTRRPGPRTACSTRLGTRGTRTAADTGWGAATWHVRTRHTCGHEPWWWTRSSDGPGGGSRKRSHSSDCRNTHYWEHRCRPANTLCFVLKVNYAK